MIKHLKKAKIVCHNVFRYLKKKSGLINVNIIATNLCNQNCPMCNTTLMRDQKNVFTIEIFKKYLANLKSYPLASCTISGGEATLVKDLPEIIEEAAKYFPVGVLLITNLYGNTSQIMKAIESALKNNVNLSISFDGFGEVADKLRGARNTSDMLEKHIALVQQIKNSMNSKSTITLHTVISDLNLQQVPKLFDYSKKLGWKHTIAPVNILYYQKDNGFSPNLTFSKKLIEVCELALSEKHVDMMESYIKGIALYAKKKTPKLCPYLKNHFRTYKFFLEPNGDISLCDRMAIGNLNDQHIDEMINSLQYKNSYNEFEKCVGCWMGCFVEPILRLHSSTAKVIRKLYELEKDSFEVNPNFRHKDVLEFPSSKISQIR